MVLSQALTRRSVARGMAAAAVLPAPGLVLAGSRARTLDLLALEARHGGRIGLFSRSAGRSIAWRAEERFPYCSTFKLFLAAFVLERVQAGKERLDRRVPVRQEDMLPHAPVTGQAVGSALTVQDLLKAAVEVSDNPAANMLIRDMGGLEAFRYWYRSIGDEVTRVDRWEVALNSALPGDERDTTTPEQAVTNLEAVLLGSRLSEEHSALLMQWIVETPTGSGRIKTAAPAGYRLGHKTGTGGNNTCNDIGILWPPLGAPIAIAVFFTGARSGSPEELDAIVAGAARAALQELGH